MKVKSAAFNQSKAALPLSQKQPHLDYPLRASLKTISRVHHICLIKQLQKKKKKLWFPEKNWNLYPKTNHIFQHWKLQKFRNIGVPPLVPPHNTCKITSSCLPTFSQCSFVLGPLRFWDYISKFLFQQLEEAGLQNLVPASSQHIRRDEKWKQTWRHLQTSLSFGRTLDSQSLTQSQRRNREVAWVRRGG